MDDHSDHAHDHDHAHDEEVESQATTGLSIRQWHIIALVSIPLLAAIGIGCSIIFSRHKNSLALVCSTVFAAGIMIATGLTATLPESEEIISHLREDGHYIAGDFPLSYTLFGVSFLSLIFIDTIVERFASKQSKDNKVDLTVVGTDRSAKECDHEPGHEQEEAGYSMKDDVEKQRDFHASCATHNAITQSAKPWAGILLTLIISIHSILECIVIGSVTEVDLMTSSYIAVAVHKVFDGFALGCGLVASGYWSTQRKKFISLSIFYVLLNLISVGIGMAISTMFSEESVVIAVLLALVGGSFLFVGVIEFIPAELEKMRQYNMPVLPVMLSLCAGFVAMTLVAKFAHSHAGHDH